MKPACPQRVGAACPQRVGAASPQRVGGALRQRAAGVAGIAVAALLLGACGGASGGEAGTRVVTSFYPLEYVAQRLADGVGGVEVVNLTQPGQEPHDLELTVRQTGEVADADVVLYESGFQPAVDAAIEQSGPERSVDAAEVADLEGDDPHFWLDPTRLATVAEAVEGELAEADPDRADAYADNLAQLQADLTALDQDFEQGLSDCRIDTVVVSHDAFGYLGTRYGLEVVAINGLSPGAEPSPTHLGELRDLIRTDQVTTVFSEELASPKFAQSLAEDLGIETAVLDPLEGLGDDTADQDYLSLMRANLEALRTANGCS